MALAEIILSAALGLAGSFLDIYGHDTVQKVQRDC